MGLVNMDTNTINLHTLKSKPRNEIENNSLRQFRNK